MYWKNKKVLITGGAGFIGSHIAERLVKAKASVAIIDLMSKAGDTKIKDFKDKLTIMDFDITKKTDYKKLSHDYNYIFHMAGITYPYEFEHDVKRGFKTNVDGTLYMLEFAAQNNKIKKFIFPSTAYVYGKMPKYVPIDEKHPIDTSDNNYGLSKKQGEEICQKFIQSSKLPVVIFRLFNTFGPRQSKEYFFPSVILQAITKEYVEIWTESPKRDFNFIQDTVDALIKGAESDVIGGPINIGSGKEVTVGEIGRFIAKKFNVEFRSLNKQVLGPKRLLCNYSLAKRLLGWKPKVPFFQGLDKTIDWFSKNHNLF